MNDWHLDAIGPREVTLTGSAGTTTLQPKSDPNLVRTGQLAPAAAAARPGVPPVQPAASGTPSPAPSEAQPPSPVARPSVPPPPPARLQNVGANTARPGNPVRATAPIAAVTAQNRTLGSPGEPQSPARSPNPERNGGLRLSSSAAKAPDPPELPTVERHREQTVICQPIPAEHGEWSQRAPIPSPAPRWFNFERRLPPERPSRLDEGVPDTILA